jgi:uncharacterized protein (TIGR02246 family)
MKRLNLILMLTVFCFACQQPQEDQQADETAIKAAFETFAAAWNNADGAAMGMAYTEDGSLLDPFGTEARGREAVGELLGKTVTEFLKGSTTSIAIEHTRFVKPDVAFVDANQTVTGAMSPEGAALPEMKFHVAATLLKTDGGWKFVDARPYQFMTQPAMQMSEK